MLERDVPANFFEVNLHFVPGEPEKLRKTAKVEKIHLMFFKND